MTKVTFTGDLIPGALQTVTEFPVVQAELTRLCEELKKLAIEIYERSIHPYPVPPPYIDEFDIVDASVHGAKAKALINRDPAFVFIEYGAHHPGTGEEVEGFAPIRRAADVLESRARGD